MEAAHSRGIKDRTFVTSSPDKFGPVWVASSKPSLLYQRNKLHKGGYSGILTAISVKGLVVSCWVQIVAAPLSQSCESVIYSNFITPILPN